LDNLSGAGPRRRGPRTGLAFALIVAVVAVAAAFLWMRAPVAAPEPSTSAPARPGTPRAPSPTPSPAGSGTGSVEIGAPENATVFVDGRRLGSGDQRVDLEPGGHDVRVDQPGHEPFVRQVQVIPGRTVRLQARPDVEAPVLHIDADVPGAQAFVDREFVGRTPVTVRDLLPGEHQINASAEGYEGQARTVVLEPGENEVMVRFKEVRLDESLAVTHKHGLGSCRGRLVATTEGLRYESDNSKDSFSLPLSQLEPLEVDYLKKNLRVKQRGGRTYNFTADEADVLLSFQKAVENARDRLAAGG